MPLPGVSTYRELTRRCLNRKDIAAGDANGTDSVRFASSSGPLAISCLAHLLWAAVCDRRPAPIL